MNQQQRGAVVITSHGQYFAHWACAISTTVSGWDETYLVPVFTMIPEYAYVYEDRRSAERAIPKLQRTSFQQLAAVD